VKIRRGIRIERTPAQVFALISAPSRYPEFFVGMTRWEPRTRRRKGLGAQFRVLMRVGSIEAGGTLRITEWKRNERIAWDCVAGLEQRGAWEVRPSDGGSELALEIEFSLARPLGWLAERIAGRVVERHMTATLLAARRLLEFEEQPNRAAKSSGNKALGRSRERERKRRVPSDRQ
jgi:ribosome-associated toxin RatA of RatAB toxin-antitoxin module